MNRPSHNSQASVSFRYSPGCPDCEDFRDMYGALSGCHGPANHGQ